MTARRALSRSLLLALIPLACGHPMDRYADIVHRTVDGSEATVARTIARLNPSGVQAPAPAESMAVWVPALDSAAKSVASSAAELGAAQPPADVRIGAAHVRLAEDLNRMARALAQLASSAHQCTAPADSTSAKGCEDAAASMPREWKQLGYANENLRADRGRLQQLLLTRGVALPDTSP